LEEREKQNQGLIDLHAHIVPGVDDGAQSFEESLKMLRIAGADGIKTIVATPHVSSAHNRIKDIEKIIAGTRAFIENLNRQPLNLRVLRGAEIFFTANVLEYLNDYGDGLTLNGSSYFLLEFPFEFIFPGTRDFIFSVLSAGWIPIIVHPERNRVIQRSPRVLFELVKMGALSQVNSGSLKGMFGNSARAAALHLLQHNLVQIIASDAHSPGRRPPELSFVHSILAEKGIENADLLLYGIPRAILDDQPVPDIGEPLDPEKKGKLFDFIKKMFN
jgi:protein-tyrosine phosphatase